LAVGDPFVACLRFAADRPRSSSHLVVEYREAATARRPTRCVRPYPAVEPAPARQPS
jgi:hypothetical protein